MLPRDLPAGKGPRLPAPHPAGRPAGPGWPDICAAGHPAATHQEPRLHGALSHVHGIIRHSRCLTATLPVHTELGSPQDCWQPQPRGACAGVPRQGRGRSGRRRGWPAWCNGAPAFPQPGLQPPPQEGAGCALISLLLARARTELRRLRSSCQPRLDSRICNHGRKGIKTAHQDHAADAQHTPLVGMLPVLASGWCLLVLPEVICGSPAPGPSQSRTLPGDRSPDPPAHTND